MKRLVLSMFAVLAMAMTANAQDRLYATYGSLPGGANASLGLYTWTATNNNLLPVFTFENGELANYTTLKFTLSNLQGGMVRMGYYVDGNFTEFGNGYGSSGDKTVDLTALGINLSQVTAIAFGGRTAEGSVNIDPAKVYLEGNGATRYASFGSLPGGANATYYDYTWTATTNNLWPLFEFANGELANYTALKFTLSDKTADSGMLRIGYYIGGSFEQFTNSDGNKGFGSNGEKVIDLTTQGINLASVTKIAFGGSTGTGSVNLRNVYVVNGDDTGIEALSVNDERVNGKVYNLAGQLVAQPTKGLYIVNGKKVMMK